MNKAMIYLFMGLMISISFKLNATPQTLSPTFVGCMPGNICFVGVSPLATTTCANKGQIRFDVSTPGGRGMYSTALASYMAGQKVHVNLTDICIDGYSDVGFLHTTK